jgi:hypothetical protein
VCVALVAFGRPDQTFKCSSFPCPEAWSDAFLSKPLPSPRIIGLPGCSGEFAHGSDISVPGAHAPRRGRILLPKSRIIGPSRHSGKFVHRSDIFAPRSSEIPAGAWARLSGFVSMSLMHLFHKEEGLGNATTSLARSSRGAH